jgi:hypothetical protein
LVRNCNREVRWPNQNKKLNKQLDYITGGLNTGNIKFLVVQHSDHGHDLNPVQNIKYNSNDLKFGPFNIWTIFEHLNTGLVWILYPHCKPDVDFKSLVDIYF